MAEILPSPNNRTIIILPKEKKRDEAEKKQHVCEKLEVYQIKAVQCVYNVTFVLARF